MTYTAPITSSSSSPMSGPTYGCTDPTATNYLAGATVDDGSCTYAGTPTVPIYSEGLTVSFSENAVGWTSFKSFVQDSGLSINNNYYTFRNTNALDVQGNITSSDFLMWKHHSNSTRNNFYRKQYDSHVDVLFNEESATVKSFASMKYEGSQSKITQDLTDPAYFNNDPKSGWYVAYGNTDLQLAGEMEFKNKEGKWFSYMKGRPVGDKKDLNSEEFSFQGIDVLDNFTVVGVVYGCTDPIATNYDPSANTDDGSCTYPPYSCWECDGNGNCDEDTNSANGPCSNAYPFFLDKLDCIANCTSTPPSLYTLTINDSTPNAQQINYSVSTFTKTGIVGDSVIPPAGTGTANILGGGSEYILEISPDPGYTVKSNHFAIEFPIGTAGTPMNNAVGMPVSFYVDDFTGLGAWTVGQGNDLGTGPLVSHVTFTDSENPTLSGPGFIPTTSNKVLVRCIIATDMEDNIPGDPNWPTGANFGIGSPNNRVYMTDNGMQSTNSINPGIPGDLDIFINIIGSAQAPVLGCTDPLAVNYNASATIDDGSCSYTGCTDPLATNYNALATVDDGSCTYPIVYGCTDNTQGLSTSWAVTDNRPEGYFGPAENFTPSATAPCDDTNGPGCVSAPAYSHITGTQTGNNCCCVYDGCNEIVQSLEGTISVTHNTSAVGNGEMTYTINNNQNSSWVPSNNEITINIYDGYSSNYVSNMQTNMFWNSSSNASGWGGMAPNYPVSSSSQGVVHTANSTANPSNWNQVGPSTMANGLGLPVGDYHMRVDTSDDCFIWYDFTIEDNYTPPNNTFGCMDSTACNYNPLSTIDNGSCHWNCYGCTDALSASYDPSATINNCACCYDLDLSVTITADSGGGGLVSNANGSIEIDIPTSYASNGVDQYNCAGDAMQIRYIVEYHDGRQPATSNAYSSYYGGCGNSSYGVNTTAGKFTWDASANSGSGGWTNSGSTSAATDKMIIPSMSCGGAGNQSALGGYEAGFYDPLATSGPTGPICTYGDAHYGVFQGFGGQSSTGLEGDANYEIRLSVGKVGANAYTSATHWCHKRLYVYVPCGTGSTTTTMSTVCANSLWCAGF